MPTETAGATRADLDERAEAAALLSRYPNLAEHELKALHRWFKRVAGPLDVGLLASDPAIAEQYRAYNRAHQDRFSARDIAIAALFIAIVAGIVFMMAA